MGLRRSCASTCRSRSRRSRVQRNVSAARRTSFREARAEESSPGRTFAHTFNTHRGGSGALSVFDVSTREISNLRAFPVFRLVFNSAQDLSPCPLWHATPWCSRNTVLALCEGYGVASIRHAGVGRRPFSYASLLPSSRQTIPRLVDPDLGGLPVRLRREFIVDHFPLGLLQKNKKKKCVCCAKDIV